MKKTILVTIFTTLIACMACSDTEIRPENISDIALYSETGAWDESVTALKKMFEWMNMSVTMIDAEYVNNNSLDGFKIICFPGGDMYRYSQNISEQSIKKIKSYVKNGGNYMGICGGAYFSAEKVIWQGNQLPMKSLGLFEGTAEGTIDSIIPYPQLGMCKVEITDTLHPITQGLSRDQWMLYYWGPVLNPNNPEIQIIGNYEAVDLPAVLAFEYGRGKVFITGTHPEIEEDSHRDGVILPDTIINGIHYLGEDFLDDKGSDWIMMKNVVDWFLEE